MKTRVSYPKRERAARLLMQSQTEQMLRRSEPAEKRGVALVVYDPAFAAAQFRAQAAEAAREKSDFDRVMERFRRLGSQTKAA